MKGYNLWYDDAKKCITSIDVTFKKDETYMGRASEEIDDLLQEFKCDKLIWK